MHLLQNIFIIENMELKLGKNVRIYKNYSFKYLIVSVLWRPLAAYCGGLLHLATAYCGGLWPLATAYCGGL